MGAWLTIPDAWRLAIAWYHDRLDPGFHGRSPEEAQAIFREFGLTGAFWSLAPSTPTP